MRPIPEQHRARRRRIALVAVLTMVLASMGVTSAVAVPAPGAVVSQHGNRADDGTDIWSQLKAGWNLGNSFDATPCETCWGNPATTKAMIDQIATKFNFLRIPVTWYPHLTTGAPSYTIDPAFLARLKQ
ncbi:MAG: glycoside hydrolase family 5, partial [Amycolatopsis sp.]|uniref:cellulase family glycosylhydrolase n=1 Tax=Amycolatopsis sp. TaxID=37632 RepID=UPI00260CC872